MVTADTVQAERGTSWRRLVASAELQAIVVGALMMREIHTRYGRENLGFLWLIAEPFIFCIGVVLVWMAVRAPYDHGVPVVAFVMTGYVPLTVWRNTIFRSVHCFRSNVSLLYHRQVHVLDLLFARIVLEVYGSFIAFLVIAFIFYVAGLYELPVDYGLFYLGWFYMILFASGLALVFACVTEMVEWVEKLVGAFTYLTLPISGAFFMAEWLPEKMREVALYVPSVHAYELIRAGQFGAGVRVHYDLEYVTFTCAALIALGLVLCRQVRRYVAIE